MELLAPTGHLVLPADLALPEKLDSQGSREIEEILVLRGSMDKRVLLVELARWDHLDRLAVLVWLDNLVLQEKLVDPDWLDVPVRQAPEVLLDHLDLRVRLESLAILELEWKAKFTIKVNIN